MNCYEVHETINRIMSTYYRVGLWHQGEKPTVKESRFKIFIFIYYLLFPVSLILGAMEDDNMHSSTFSLLSAIMVLVVALKLSFLIWKQKQIVELLNRICVHHIHDREEFDHFNDKLKRLMKFLNFVLGPTIVTALACALVAPFFENEKTLFFKIKFPLDWRNDDFAYWLAFSYIFSIAIISSFVFVFTAIIWYLMWNCALKYSILGDRIKKLGVVTEIDGTERQGKIGKNIYHEDLIQAIQFYHRTREEIQHMLSFFSVIFLAQLATNGICIYISILRLIFSLGETFVDYMIDIGVLFYGFFEIFMVMYFGNEIKSSSDRLVYCLFESNWIDQPESNKKCILIFGEIVQQPHVLVVCKTYSLTLQTFTRILNSAYSILNILSQYV